MRQTYSVDGRLRLREFADGTVVFDPLSWNAHLLNPAAAAVLDLCRTAPASVDDVERLLAEILAAESRDLAGTHAAQVLAELEDLGLVRRDAADAH